MLMRPNLSSNLRRWNTCTINSYSVLWTKKFSLKCQSPIDICSKETEEMCFPKFNFKNFIRPECATIRNTGYTIQVLLKNNKEYSMCGGGLPEQYHLENIHFHWESEHTIDGKNYPLEIHLVFMNSSMKCKKEAAENGGFSVLGTLVQCVDQVENNSFEAVVNQVECIHKPDPNPVDLKKQICVMDFLPNDTSTFFRYTGSSTIPSCYERVMWTVFETPLCICGNQIEKLKNIKGNDGEIIEENNRSIQPLQGRVVHRSKEN